jgi:hypothetical protein
MHPQDSSTVQVPLEATFGNENRYVDMSFDWYKLVQMTLTNPSVDFAFFHLLVQVHPQHPPTRQADLESSWGIDHRYVNV